jgi:putative membrane protein
MSAELDPKKETVPAQNDPRVYFAEQRTFLAWIRTGLALMGFGFVVARFGLFMRELTFRSSGSPQASSHTTGPSVWLGTALVIVGVIVNLSAVMTHIRQVRQLRTGQWIAGRISKTAVTLALLLSAAGIGLAIYLIWVR